MHIRGQVQGQGPGQGRFESAVVVLGHDNKIAPRHICASGFAESTEGKLANYIKRSASGKQKKRRLNHLTDKLTY